jgi:hypothetical protein
MGSVTTILPRKIEEASFEFNAMNAPRVMNLLNHVRREIILNYVGHVGPMFSSVDPFSLAA